VLFALGAALFLWDFFIVQPRRAPAPASRLAESAP
jgi:hypothetical protein